ncbi:protein kinase domain-containing protein [Chitinimonas lacunae]|uniref:Winged helix-turn-helix domain-containing protein n=1 Tax=Chitinimonas lacunae TaxID=1963018 RepID=A0ABV8MTF5_9NEIS
MSPSNLYRYRFGSSTFDESTCELTVSGLVVDIQPQSLRILSLLLNHRGEVISRKELEEQVWQGRHVGENVLASAITRLRAALGESNAGLIEAIPRVGYRITAPVQRTAIGQYFSSHLALQVGQEAPERPGYQLERMLGQSGAGEVWLARYGKTRAVRVYKYAADASQLARLKREATLARLLHEQLGERRDILRIVDWNFENAPFFLESEYGGDNLLTWSQADNRLAMMPREARLAVFLQIARAVAAAHSVGVIHKDLKPANVLLDGAGQARLVDFGSSRLTDHHRLAELGITDLGVAGAPTLTDDSARGTVLYIAPEILREHPSTERSDIYALGVLLYQLVVGDLRRPMVQGWERDIDDPLLCEDIAAATDGDIERRTASVNELIVALSDLPSRRLRREQEAAERAQAERDRLQAQRSRERRPWLIGLMATLALGLVISVYAYLEVRQSEARLVHHSQNIRALNQFLARELIGEADPSQSGRSNVSVQEAAILATKKIDAPGSGYSPEVRALLHAAMQRTFDGLGDFKRALSEGEKALAALAQQTEPDPLLLDNVHVTYASTLRSLSRLEEAEAQLALVEKSLPRLNEAPNETLARYWYVKAKIASVNYAWHDVLRYNAKAAEVFERLPAPKSSLGGQIDYTMAHATKMVRDYPKAEAMYRALLQNSEARYGQVHYLTCIAKRGLGDVLSVQSRNHEAIPLIESAIRCIQQAVGEDTIEMGNGISRLANAYFSNDQWIKAAETNLRAAAIHERISGPTGKANLVAQSSAAWAFTLGGFPEKAKPIFARTLAQARQVFPENHPIVQIIRFNYADCLLDTRQIQGVRELLDGLDAKTLGSIRPDPVWEGLLAYQQGRLALLNGDQRQAMEWLEFAEREVAAKNPDKRTISLARIRQYLAKART